MYSLVKSVPFKQLVLEKAPIFSIALFLAETFYKFHSFILECIAFLLTWFVLDAITDFFITARRKQAGKEVFK